MSLYNEVRPVTLKEVRGQEKIVAQVRAIIENACVPNVSLFVGPRGTGKTTVARIFARAINCENPSEDGPCNTCKTCQDIQADNSLDVMELDAASHNKVDDVHRLIEGSGYAPVGKYKVYIIDEVHMLSTAAFNALLKLLEEPPAHCRFILCTTEEHKVPVTILSRCRKFYFERISLGVVADKMASICKDRDIPYEEEALRLIAKKSEGCMRDAESLLEIFLDAKDVSFSLVSSILGTTSEETVWGILGGIADGNLAASFERIRDVKRQGKNLHLLIKSLIEALSDLVYFHQSGELSLVDNTASYKEYLSETAGKLNVDRALEISKALSEIYISAVNGGNVEFLLETKLLILLSHQSALSQLTAKLEALENALFEGISFTAVRETGVEESQAAEVNVLEKSISVDKEVPTTLEENFQESSKVSEEDFVSLSPALLQTPSIEGNFLPGDIHLPEGTEFKGVLNIFGTGSGEESLPEGFSSLENSEQEIPFEASNVTAVPTQSPEQPMEEKSPEEESVPEQPSPFSDFDSMEILGFGGCDFLLNNL